jgi:hypothetical protein
VISYTKLSAQDENILPNDLHLQTALSWMTLFAGEKSVISCPATSEGFTFNLNSKAVC